MEADEGSNGSDSARGSQFRRRRSEPVHRRPRTLSQNNTMYGSGRASDSHLLQGDEDRKSLSKRPAWEERKGSAWDHHNGDGRVQHRQTKLIGRDEETVARHEVRNGKYRQENGYHEHREEKRETCDGDIRLGRESGSRVEASFLLKKGNRQDRIASPAETAVNPRSMNGVGERDYAASGRVAMAGNRPPALVRDKTDGDYRNEPGIRGDDVGRSHCKSPSSVRTGLTKLKLKVGGVTHTLHSNSLALKSVEKDPEPPGKRRRHRLILEVSF